MKLHEGAAPLNVAMQENYLAWREAQTQVADNGLRDNHRAFQEMLWLLGIISLLVVLVIVLSWVGLQRIPVATAACADAPYQCDCQRRSDAGD